MALNPLWYDATIIAGVNSVTALCNSGFLNIYTGSQPSLDGGVTGTLLAQLTFGSTAFATATAAAGTVTALANAIGSGLASATGTAGYFALLKSNGTTVVMTGAVGTSGADLNLSSLTVTSGQTVACGSFSITQVQT